jgi:hypothetical protein
MKHVYSKWKQHEQGLSVNKVTTKFVSRQMQGWFSLLLPVIQHFCEDHLAHCRMCTVSIVPGVSRPKLKLSTDHHLFQRCKVHEVLTTHFLNCLELIAYFRKQLRSILLWMRTVDFKTVIKACEWSDLVCSLSLSLTVIIQHKDHSKDTLPRI